MSESISTVRIQNNKCICIIPFYNEKKTIFGILDRVLEIKRISKIVCVDDCSTDKASELIEEKYPKIKLIKSPTNQGKSNAIKLGLVEAHDSEYVIMIDADVQKLDVKLIEDSLDYVLQKGEVDMLIFKRAHEPIDFLSRVMRSDTLLSGERIVRTSDLQKVMEENPKGYQLEVVMNLYMKENNKKVCFVKSPVVNPSKKSRRGYIKGLAADYDMTFGIFRFAGYKKYLELVNTFCKEEYKPVKNVLPAN